MHSVCSLRTTEQTKYKTDKKVNAYRSMQTVGITVICTKCNIRNCGIVLDALLHTEDIVWNGKSQQQQTKTNNDLATVTITPH